MMGSAIEILNLDLLVPWCHDGTNTNLSSAPTVFGDVPAGPSSFLLELVGMFFQYAGAKAVPNSATYPVPGVTTLVVTPRFEVCQDFSQLPGLFPPIRILETRAWKFLPRRARIRVIEGMEAAFGQFAIRRGSINNFAAQRWLQRAIADIWESKLQDLVDGRLTTVCIDTWVPTVTVSLFPNGSTSANVSPDLVWVANRRK